MPTNTTQTKLPSIKELIELIYDNQPQYGYKEGFGYYLVDNPIYEPTNKPPNNDFDEDF